LGDELEADGDTSYLDEAISAPSVPTKVPGASTVYKLLLIFYISLNYELF
jgi:hypothetical protein